MMEIVALAAVLLVGVVVGVLLRRHEGRVRDSASGQAVAAQDAPQSVLLSRIGVGADNPVVLHFSADWCGPCAAVRRVVTGVVADLSTAAAPPLDIEVDIDAEPALAKELNVLSLPTTFVFDVRGRERFRISGVPKATDLRSALVPLTLAVSDCA